MIYAITFLVILLSYILNRYLYKKVKAIKSINKMDDNEYLKTKYNPQTNWWDSEIEKATLFEFNEVIPSSNRDFWVGKSCYIKEVDQEGHEKDIKCILHVKTNLVLSIDGELLGRNINGEFVDVSNLPLDVKQWYSKCGF